MLLNVTILTVCTLEIAQGLENAAHLDLGNKNLIIVCVCLCTQNARASLPKGSHRLAMHVSHCQSTKWGPTSYKTIGIAI